MLGETILRLVVIWPLITNFVFYKYEEIHAWIAKEAQKMTFSTLDLLPGFSKVPYRKLQVTSADSVHPNALGHKMAVEVFMKWYNTNKDKF